MLFDPSPNEEASRLGGRPRMVLLLFDPTDHVSLTHLTADPKDLNHYLTKSSLRDWTKPGVSKR
jgi:hypothetical protein